MKAPSNRIEFANTLRGVACVAVLLSHYIGTFGMIRGEYGGFAALPKDVYPSALMHLFEPALFDWGGMGVALFFLISGLVIPMSVDAMARGSTPRIAFVVARFWRIVPTYAVGALISAVALLLAARYDRHQPWDIGIGMYLANISLFRDWIGVYQFDGVVWTLEVESKFYLAVLLFWSMLRLRQLIPIAMLCAAAIAVSTLKVQYPMSQTWNPPANFLWPLKYLAYMGIGIAFNYHFRGALSSTRLAIVATVVMAAFWGVCVVGGDAMKYPISYTVALVLFAFLYFRARTWSGGFVLRFLAGISFPLYAVHAPIGYIILRTLMGRGWYPAAALAVATCVAISLAWLIHRFVEQPTQGIGKRLSGKIQQFTAEATSTP